ncbi:MAG TPA: hypothetical protein VJ761_22985 [Ktedonobacteraceae bacterium]|nr:hypothetical protein [Ktedonobacteraceae bacterium]
MATYEEVRQQVMFLKAEEQLELLKLLMMLVLPKVKIEPEHSVLEFGGIGKGAWEGVDVQKFIEEERKSW